MPTWLAWVLLANVGVSITEYIYRAGAFSSFLNALPFLFIPIFISQMGLFYGFRVGGADTLIMAGIVFNVVNQVFRSANSYLLHEPLGWKQLVATLLMVVAFVVLRLK